MVVVCPLWASLARFCVRFVFIHSSFQKKMFLTQVFSKLMWNHMFVFFNQNPQISSGEEIHRQIQQAHKSSANLNSFFHYFTLTYLKHSRVNLSSHGATCGFFFVLLYVRVWEDHLWQLHICQKTCKISLPQRNRNRFYLASLRRFYSSSTFLFQP